MVKKTTLYIGTSGWSYDHWKDIFYPSKMKSNDRLEFYGQNFDTVEINSTFYHLPKVDTIKHWNQVVPKTFIFSIKASQYITHRKRLKEPEKTLPAFFERLSYMKAKVGVILIQLPPSFKKDMDRIQKFVKHLKKNYRYTFEFRHESWFEEEVYTRSSSMAPIELERVYAFLKKNKIALCITDWHGSLSPEMITTDFTYIRLHGPQGTYQGYYDLKTLKLWKKKMLAWKKKKISIFCYFDNDDKGYAIKDAFKLRQMISKI